MFSLPNTVNLYVRENVWKIQIMERPSLFKKKKKKNQIIMVRLKYTKKKENDNGKMVKTVFI